MANPVEHDHISEDRLAPYRQPIVTATGIILGFVLNFAGNFVKADATTSETIAWLTLGLLAIGVVCLIVVLARALMLGVPPSLAARWYKTTRIWFLVGISAALAGALVDMLANFLAE